MKVDDNADLKFHYNRQRRLENAPEAVRRSYEEGENPNRGFIHGLTANTGLRSVFFIIIILCASIFFLTFFGDPANQINIEGIQVQLKAFLFEETVYITFKCSPNELSSPKPGPVKIKVTGTDFSDTPVFEQDLDGFYNGSELLLRTTMSDYELKTVTGKVNFNKKDASLSVTVDRK